MKKLIILSVLTLISSVACYGQWVTKTVDNKLDAPYKIAYCIDVSNKSVLKLETVGEQLAFYITGSYFCDEAPTVDIGLIVNGESKKYSVQAIKSSDSKALFLIEDLLVPEQLDFFKDLKACTSAIVRVNETYCSTDVFKFNMSGSTKAVTFMLN